VAGASEHLLLQASAALPVMAIHTAPWQLTCSLFVTGARAALTLEVGTSVLPLLLLLLLRAPAVEQLPAAWH
jgi:hypothetical protein